MDNFTENKRLSQLFSSHDSSCLTTSELSTCLHILSKRIFNEENSQSSRYYFKASKAADSIDRGVDSLAHTSSHDLRRQELFKKPSTFSLTALSILDALEQDRLHPEFNFDLSNIVDKHIRFVPGQHGHSFKFDFTI